MLPFAGAQRQSTLEAYQAVDVDGLRPDYQEPAVTAGLAHAASGSTELGVLNVFTGGGKTRTAIALVRRWLLSNGNDRCLWIANRTFLIEDAIARLAKSLGVFISREQAASKASATRVVVGSMATLKDARLAAMDPDAFGLIVADECQYLDTPGGQAILAHFKRATPIGLSATPGSGKILFARDVMWGIENGYFVPMVPRFERVIELDVSGIKSAKNASGARDLQISALEESVLKAALPIADAVWKHCQDRRPIIYTPGVASAHAVAKILNERRPNFIESVDAKTPPAERRRMREACEAGTLQGLINCGIYLFGFDAPWADAIVIARLTEDWGLYLQMVGRGGRPAPGIGELATVEERRAAIAASIKPNMLLLDITGQHGKHSICGPADIDQGLPGDVKARVKKTLEKDPGTLLTDAIKEAKAWKRGEYDRLARAAVHAKIKTAGGTFDPFHSAGVRDREAYQQYAPAWTKEPASLAQRQWLGAQKLPVDISKGEASKLRAQADKWQADGRASYSQRLELSKLNLPHDLPWQQAADLLYACPVAWVKGQRVRTAPAREVTEQILMAAQAQAGVAD